MLAEFRVSNYRSFKEEQVLSLIATSDESGKPNCVELGGLSILKTAVVYGANASGKSNLMKAMDCMNKIVRNSAGYKPDEKIPVTPFLFDKKTREKPTEFEVTFFMEGIRYQYRFSATKEKIWSESLLAWPKGRQQIWFERDCKKPIPYFGNFLKGQNIATWEKVKENSLFLSVAPQWNHKQLSNVYEWFSNKIKQLPDISEGIQYTDEMLLGFKNSKDLSDFYEIALDWLRQADFGIDDLRIEKSQVEPKEIEFPDDFPETLKENILNNIKEHPPHEKKFFHCKNKYSLSIEEESDGTQRFYSFLGPLIASNAFGYTIFKDELEESLHPLLTRQIVSSIYGNESDGSNAQLIFTTHDTSLLDPELFGRGQIWFTEKDEHGATQLYSLADYKDVRKDEAMQKRYLAGRYGAIPVLERFNIGGTKK